jgi:hypothetical protein
VVNTFKQRLDLSINIILIIAMMCVTIYLITSGIQNKKFLKRKVSDYKQKIKIVNQSETVQAQYDDYYDQFPKTIEVEQLNEILSDFAGQTNTEIVALTPGQKTTVEMLDVTGMRIQIQSPTYVDSVLFIKMIEDSEFALRVDNWQCNMVDSFSTRRLKKRGKSVSKLQCDIQLSNYKINSDIPE